MEIAFVAGFGPIGQDPEAMVHFWAGTLGLPVEEISPGYYHSTDIRGVKAFGLWPLTQAAQSTFGTDRWPGDRPVPQAWIELEVSSPEAVAEAAEELRKKGQEILVGAHEEPWGQTVARLLSPEGLLVGVSYLPSFHCGEGESEGA